LIGRNIEVFGQIHVLLGASNHIKNQINAVCKASSFEEPGAIIPHAGICEGAVG